jgi:hypothetical protein
LVSSIPNNTELEIPAPMIALVATAVILFLVDLLNIQLIYEWQIYAAITDWQTGSFKPRDFTASAYTDVYLRHITTLSDIKVKNPSAYHALTASLFKQCM